MDLRPPPTILQFAATLVSRNAEDRSREFVVAYHVEDRAFAIAERYIPNSGFRGGKFMEKTVVNNPKTGNPYEPREIFIGASIDIGGRIFMLQEASEDALKIMEARSDVFTKCDLASVVEAVRKVVKGKVPQILVDFQKLDPKKTGRVSLENLQTVLKKYGVPMGDQEFLTLFRRFQYLDSDRFLYQDFVSGLV